ncbi:Glu/Leu/Phe/Val family dehydrogenase [Croceicoccus naphthovorans]|uniref:Amino acid dehydrogenase n=1 Tax=Croceicoccus naphthovorans TaxID=1348774 RepID=A0A0G3XJ01_9SPHN|nr:Glu/Leu/Phe/Val dehydrogenase dimerization domain-containing protein [Croceicoccus naphthovorans]AKM10586.1 amino acid dehydrogenase [Croceicoccus naphthovorans]MBB3988802.1 leucine dehydrogenase [Croceicoccus naphthovorans]
MWNNPAFDDHEKVTLVHDRKSGLRAIIAIHSTHLGPSAGGTRFWHYADSAAALTDALRLSQGMSYKNALAGLPIGGGKAVILADADRTKTDAMMLAFGEAIEKLGGQYVTAEDVGITEADMALVNQRTDFVTGLPAKGGEPMVGSDPGPFTSYGIFLGVKQAVKHKLGKDSVAGVHIALQGTGSVGSGLARHLAHEGAVLTLADVNADRAAKLAAELGGKAVSADEVMTVPCDVFSPNALGAILTPESIAALDCAIVAGGANNQLATVKDGDLLAKRDILFAPDYVINAGGIISVMVEYLARGGPSATIEDANGRIEQIPERLEAIWQEAASTGTAANRVADAMARRAIGR